MSIPLFLLTFNCGKLKINAADFSQEVQHSLPDTPPELFVFGFQEICSILDGSFPQAVRKHLIDINRIILHALKTKYVGGSDTDYAFTTVGIHHMGAIGMVAVTPYASKFGSCRFAQSSCGYGQSSLKGGVAMRVSYTAADSSRTELTFATAHLSAYEGAFYYDRRLQDIQTLMRSLDFGDGYSFLKPNTHAFFMGDLNFRTTKNPNDSKSAVDDLVAVQDTSEVGHHSPTTTATTDIADLVARYDELTLGRVNAEVFAGFDEPCIKFRPTYKYHLNTAIYNSKRCPSWCDRILFQSTYKQGTAPVVHDYNSIPTYLGSDHRPVYLQVTVPLEAPEPIIGPNGYLVVLPVVSHLEHNSQIRDFDPNISISGPTQVYMKTTGLDRLNQYFLRRLADFTIGYGLWFSTTPSGRLALLALVLAGWVIYAI
ncbi:hypothetical protein JCM33374_g6141 [Metschnikowia sp. JCM 33374]|nr:hypothetical protein JCM33374_g6141 [Metschnikowia sp. JCM 33374]